MNKPSESSASKAVDSIQQRLTNYAFDLKYADLPPEVIHGAKVRIIDTLGALIGGFFYEPCRIARNLAAQLPDPQGATVIGTRMKTTLEMAAFVNPITARYAEMNDSYHRPESAHGHASDVITPVLATAEHVRSSGREFITNVVLAYEVFLRISDVFRNGAAFDTTTLGCLSVALATGKMLGLSANQLSHCISMAVVPNAILKQVNRNPQTMFKAIACGQAGRAGVFAALLARAGMEGPHLPFEGKAGWCDHIARGRFSLDTLGGRGAPFRILDTQIKTRPANGSAIGCILAAEKVAPLNIVEVKHITVEVYQRAKEVLGTGEHAWNPNSRSTADHSAPYLVAATLLDGTITQRSFDDAHLWNPQLRALMQKIEVIENEEFTKAFERLPVEHRNRVTVVTHKGERLVGESGGDQDDISMPKNDAQIEEKFRRLTEDVLSTKQVNAILERLWHLDELENVAMIPPAFALD